MFSFKLPKSFYYASAFAATFGAACLVKEWTGGKRYPMGIDANGKVVVVTGANTGIGKQTAWDLARRGAKVYMACRNMRLCEEARKEIVLDTENKYVYCRHCDLASLKSIREFVRKFKQEVKQLDVLINNAGVMRTPNSKTADGFEMQLGVNHLGHFLLTNLLLDELKAAPAGRVVNVSSIAHLRGKISKDDLNSDKNYDAGDAYAQSKLANVLFTMELANRMKGTAVTVNAVHPGLVDTEIIRHMSFFNSWISTIILKPFVWPFVKSPTQGAQTTIFAAIEPGLEKVTGQYFVNYEESNVSPLAKDVALQKWLWQVSEKWTRLNEAVQ